MQEDRAERPEVHEERDAVGDREGAPAEEVERQHRLGGAALPCDEGAEHAETAGQRGEDERAGPALRGRADDAEDDGEQPRADEADARHVEARLGAVALAQARGREREQGEAERDVDPEDPLPAQAGDDGAADQRTEGDAHAADARPDAQRGAAPLGREGVGEQREGERGDGRAADALQGAGGDQLAAAGCERRGGRRQGEQRQCADEGTPAAEAITDRRARDEGHGEGERVGVDRPLELLERGAEVLADRRQRDGDDEVVEDDHEQRQRRDRQGPSGARGGGGHSVAPMFSEH